METQTESFFPRDVDDFRPGWYAANLKAMREPCLFGLGSPVSRLIGRCLWLSSFRTSICVRVELDAVGTLFAKEISCDASEKPAELVKDVQIAIPAAPAGCIVQMLQTMGFFELPTNEELPYGLDGERWIFEVLDKGRYHVVDRYCPDVMERDRPSVELDEYLLTLAGTGFSSEGKVAKGA
ncbi:MAG TPA: hypothetical protein V6D08_21310 [Candidatus Obscuribacterales bacterium]